MSSPRTVSWQLLGLQHCSSSPTRTRKSIHLWGSEWRLQGNKSNLASLTRAYFFMCIYSVIVIIMFTKVKVEALVLNAWCFIKRPFLLQSRRNWGLLCVCVCSHVSVLFSHFIFLKRRSTDENDCSQMVSMSPLIGCRLKFQTDQSLSLSLAQNVTRLNRQRKEKDGHEAGCKWRPVTSAVSDTFLLWSLPCSLCDSWSKLRRGRNVWGCY